MILTLFAVARTLTAVNLFVPARMVNAFLIIIGLAVPFAMSLAALAALINGFRPARLFLAAYGLFFAGVLLFALTTGGLIPFSVVSFHGFQTGTIRRLKALSNERIRRYTGQRRQGETAWLEGDNHRLPAGRKTLKPCCPNRRSRV